MTTAFSVESQTGSPDIDDLARLCTEKGLTIGVAESLTSGLLSSRVGEGADAATWFAGGVVAYRTATKERFLGLEPDADPCTPASAEQLAVGAREILAVDVAVSTTGVGGPDPHDGHEPGEVHLGWSTETGSGSIELALDGTPEEVIAAAADQAVALLCRIAASVSGNVPRSSTR